MLKKENSQEANVSTRKTHKKENSKEEEQGNSCQKPRVIAVARFTACVQLLVDFVPKHWRLLLSPAAAVRR